LLRTGEAQSAEVKRRAKIKPKINKWYLMKIKRFCIAKETINKIK